MRRLKSSCPSWALGGPHSWHTDTPGVYANVCNECGISRAEARGGNRQPSRLAQAIGAMRMDVPEIHFTGAPNEHQGT